MRASCASTVTTTPSGSRAASASPRSAASGSPSAGVSPATGAWGSVSGLRATSGISVKGSSSDSTRSWCPRIRASAPTVDSAVDSAALPDADGAPSSVSSVKGPSDAGSVRRAERSSTTSPPAPITTRSADRSSSRSTSTKTSSSAAPPRTTVRSSSKSRKGFSSAASSCTDSRPEVGTSAGCGSRTGAVSSGTTSSASPAASATPASASGSPTNSSSAGSSASSTPCGATLRRTTPKIRPLRSTTALPAWLTRSMKLRLM